MAITVKVVQRPLPEASYLRATLRGMALTFSHLFRPKVTMQVSSARSNLETASDTTGEEVVGDELARDRGELVIEEVELDGGSEKS